MKRRVNMAKNRNGRGEKKARFVCLPHDVMDTLAWKRLSCVSQAVWLQFARVHNGSNNGRIAMSERTLGERLNVSKNTASRAINELVTFGFLVRTRASSFIGKRIAAEYLMTHVADDRTDPKGIPLRTYQNIGKTSHLRVVALPSRGRL